MKSPLKKPITTYRTNRTLHGRSVYRKKDVPGHNVFWGYNSPGTGDGLDLFEKGGEPVFAMHSGKATQIQNYGRNGKVAIVGDNIKSLYAHIHVKDGIDNGEWVEEGQVIGYIGKVLNDPHLHLEVWVGNKSISGPTAKKLATKLQALLD